MNIHLQLEIFRRYPNLYRDAGTRFLCPEILPDLNIDERLVDDFSPFDERGIECGDEWFHLVDVLSSACEVEIESLISKSITKEHWPRIAQVKEKFGCLRFYVTGQVSEDLRAKILQVEQGTSS